MNPALTLREEWDRFVADLALCLGDLDQDDVLILSLQGPVNYYVQFVPYQGAVRAEAAGNQYILPADAHLSLEEYALMVTLGWHRPTSLPPKEEAEPEARAGSPNFFLDLPVPVDTQALAALTVRTLREVYRVTHPAELEYHSFVTQDGTGIRFPSLGIKRRRRIQPDESDLGEEPADTLEPPPEPDQTIRRLRAEKARFVAVLDWLLKSVGGTIAITLADLRNLSPDDQVSFWLDEERGALVLTRSASTDPPGTEG